MWLFFVFAVLGHVCAQQISPNQPSDETSRIIYGQPASIQEYNYAAQIIYRNALHCGGIIITQRHVLSAGHCFFTPSNALFPVRDVTVRVGAQNTNSGGQNVGVSTIVVHNQYNIPFRDNDLAIVVLSANATLGSLVQPARLMPANSSVPDNANAVYVGWGIFSASANPSPSLNQVSVIKVNQSACAATYSQLIGAGAPYTVTNNMICVGSPQGGDACLYDDGGPLIYNGTVVGVIAWGYQCGNSMYPGVNMAIANYRPWIADTIQRYNSGTYLTPLSVIIVFVVALCSKMIN